MKLKEGHWYKFNDRGDIHIGYYLGTDADFPCCVCDKGHKAHTFNIWYKTPNCSNYETWGFGKEHMPEILEDLGEVDGLVYDRIYND